MKTYHIFINESWPCKRRKRVQRHASSSWASSKYVTQKSREESVESESLERNFIRPSVAGLAIVLYSSLAIASALKLGGSDSPFFVLFGLLPPWYVHFFNFNCLTMSDPKPKEREMTCYFCFMNHLFKKQISLFTMLRWLHNLVPIRNQLWPVKIILLLRRL